MKLLTLNFLTCARKACKQEAAAFPLHPQEAELEQVELDMNPLFIKNILLRVDWEAMKIMSQEVQQLSPQQTPSVTVMNTCDQEFRERMALTTCTAWSPRPSSRSA